MAAEPGITTPTPPRWITTSAGLVEVVEELVGQEQFAFDTEFHRERTYYPQLALLQLAWGSEVALVDPLAVDLRPLAPCFDGRALVVAHAATQDLEVIDRACGVLPSALRHPGGRRLSGLLHAVARHPGPRRLGHPPAEGRPAHRLAATPAYATQLTYAASDVAHLLELASRITEQLELSGRLDWARQECVEMYAAVRAPQDPDTAWWRIKEVRHLRGKSRAVAQEVGAWRERTAAEMDRPVRTVLPDMAVLAIANNAPSTLEAMRSLRGVEGRVPKGAAGNALLPPSGRASPWMSAGCDSPLRTMSTGGCGRRRPWWPPGSGSWLGTCASTPASWPRGPT